MEAQDRPLEARPASVQAVQAEPREAAPAPKPAGAIDRVAVIATHGMGQQVHYETLEELAGVLKNAALRRGLEKPQLTTDFVQIEGNRFPQVRLTIPRAGGGSREVHLYEAYWAPLTEGRVSLRESFWFLLMSGWDGARRASSDNHGFWRRLFQRDIRFSVGWHVWAQFMSVIVVLLSLAWLNGLVVAVVASRTVSRGTNVWPSDPLLGALTADVSFLIVAIVLVFLSLLPPRPFRVPPDRPGRAALVPPVVRVVSWLFMVAGLLCIPAMAVSTIVHVLNGGRTPSGPWIDLGIGPWVASGLGWSWGHWKQMLFAGVVWGAAAYVMYRVRNFTVQYAGDVVAYVSAHKVSRFRDVREAVKEAAHRVFHAVYSRREPDGAWTYDRVVAMGHSLGSVVAYDALDRVLLDDIAADSPLGAAERTAMLLTYGSPLDKTAFVFGTQHAGHHRVREALAAGNQPLILDYRRRPAHWVNLYSPDDWISGSLTYYDDRDQQEWHERFVDNRRDPESVTPLAAHTEYAAGRALGDLLYETLASPDLTPPPPPMGGVRRRGPGTR